MPKDKKYTVGYKKPPKNTQFKKGESGNPKGRPPKVEPIFIVEEFLNVFENEALELVDIREGDRLKKSAMESLHKILSEKIETNINGEYKKMTYLEVMIQSLINGSIKLNPHALKVIIPLLLKIDTNVTKENEEIISLSNEVDQNEISQKVGEL